MDTIKLIIFLTSIHVINHFFSELFRQKLYLVNQGYFSSIENTLIRQII